MVSGRALQLAVVIFLVILIILLMKSYIGITEMVMGITLGIGALVVSATLEDRVVHGGKILDIDEIPDCCTGESHEGGRDGQGMNESIDFKKILAQKIKAKKGKKANKVAHAHQEACRDVLTGLTGNEFLELSASKPKPKGDHVVATKDHLPNWYKVVDGEHIYLDMDGWLADERVGFEYRGPVHDEVDKVQENDTIKEKLAMDQAVKLMILHYGIPVNLMTRYIYTKLVGWKVPLLHGLPRIAKLSPEQMSKLDWSHPKRLENLKKSPHEA